MALLSGSQLQAVTDKAAGAYRQLLALYGSKAVTVTTATLRWLVNQLLLVPVASADYEIETDLAPGFNSVLLQGAHAEAAAAFLTTALSAVQTHVQKRGAGVDATITSLATYLAYLNTTPYSTLLAPELADLWPVLYPGKALAPAYCYQRGISPDLNAAYPNGMGVRAVGGAFTAGAAPDLTKYAEVNLLAVVTADFAAGTAAPTVTVTGTDNTGNAAQTWTGTFTGNNPASAVATTLTAAVATAWQRASPTVAAGAGIVPGSVLVVDAGTPQQETIIVEATPAGAVTAVFMKTHAGGATLTGKTTVALTPGTAGRRCRAVTNLVVNVTGHTGGTVRVDGAQDRVAI